MPYYAERDIGRLEARQESQDERLDRIETKMDTVLEFVSQAKGGWRMLSAVAAIGGATGALITKIIHMLFIER
jgi:hypothetical protein